MAHHVFISHSSNDKTTADAVCAALEKAGILCWMAPRDIRPGQNYGEAIFTAIEASRAIVLVFSAHANASPHVLREIECAVDSARTIIPLHIENITPTRSMKYFLGTQQRLDAFAPPLERHLETLVKTLLIQLDLPPTSPPQSEAHTTNSSPLKADALLEKGQKYYHGTDVGQDYTKAAEFFHQASDQGNIAAKVYLGCCYANGQGVKVNYKRSFEYFEAAAKQGYVYAQYNLGVMYRQGKGIAQDHMKAVTWFSKAAKQGNAKALFYLGRAYDTGLGAPRNPVLAYEHYKNSAFRGNAEAQYNLGFSRFYGDGVAQDHGKAVYWYKKSAAQGFAPAQCELGYACEIGHGVARDLDKALEYYEMSAKQGNERARAALARLHTNKT